LKKEEFKVVIENQFTQEDFQKMILKTYSEPNDETPNIADLMGCIQKHKLYKYSPFLTEDFELNAKSSPAIDMGNEPLLFSN